MGNFLGVVKGLKRPFHISMYTMHNPYPCRCLLERRSHFYCHKLRNYEIERHIANTASIFLFSFFLLCNQPRRTHGRRIKKQPSTTDILAKKRQKKETNKAKKTTIRMNSSKAFHRLGGVTVYWLLRLIGLGLGLLLGFRITPLLLCCCRSWRSAAWSIYHLLHNVLGM